MSARKLKIHHYPAAHASDLPPLLFIHGAYANAGCWALNFIPFFTARGYTCHALDLSGHGESAGRERLDEFGLDDYAADLATAVASLPALPVLITHSMGTLVAQRYLSTGSAVGVAFLSPVPPSGTGGSAARLALTQPDFFEELPRAVSGHPTARGLEVMAAVYFSPDTRGADITQFLPMIQPESNRAVMEMMNLAFQPSGHRPAIPALVMGGAEDAVFSASMLFFTALAWKARSVTIARAGHMLMLEAQWPAAAGALAEWLATL